MARQRRKKGRRRQKPEFDQQLVDIARVTRVVAGGRRMRFRVTMVIGDRKNRVGVGIAKANDVSSAVEKAVNKAKKNMITVPVTENGTIPHEIMHKTGSARVFLKPAYPGTGIIAGGSVRSVMELAGVKNVFSKIYGTNNKLNNVAVTLDALSSLKTREQMFAKRGKEVPKAVVQAIAKEEAKKEAKAEKTEKKEAKKPAAKKPAKKTIKAEKPKKAAVKKTEKKEKPAKKEAKKATKKD